MEGQMTNTDAWDPARYGTFGAERRQPFDDLVAACRAVPGGTVVDLGCGAGELTVDLHTAMGAARTVGLDRSTRMLDQARALGAPEGVEFVEGDIATSTLLPADLLFANASLQWIDGHRELLARLRATLRPGGQLAFQVPANFGHPSHLVAFEVAAEAPFAAALADDPPKNRGEEVLQPAAYAQCFYDLGATDQRVWLTVYHHLLASSAAVVDWVEGTMLTQFRSRLDPDTYAAFLARYRERLLGVLGDVAPYFYTYPRILAWARFA
jgi:trans-aconitate 2-methyltransferase